MGGSGLNDSAESEAKRTARRARGASDEIASQAAAIGEDMREEARNLAAEVRDAAQSLIDEQKVRVAELAQGFAHALRRSADAFTEEGGTLIARYAGRVADQVEEFSESVRTQSWRDMLTTAEDAARRRPELFLAGAVAAGFLVGRMLTGGRDSLES